MAVGSFIERLCEAVAQTNGGAADSRRLIGRALIDTVTVAAAGFGEPVSRAALSAYKGVGSVTWSGEQVESREAAIMLNGIAAHALDFDDVYLDSSTHPSAVIVPAILHMDDEHDPDEVISAVGAGLIAARAVAARLGREHYARGWHGTGTIGAFAAAAAAARLARLDPAQIRAALGLAAAMSGGLQINFSTMAKPAHAGFSASAGVRAARLAAAGVSAAQDVFGPGGYADLYGDADATSPADSAFDLRPDQVAVKLYPCCFAANRLVGVALDAYKALGGVFSDPAVRMRLSAPSGSLRVLRFDRPVNGMQAKFSGPYTMAAALLDGSMTMAHFQDEQIGRADIRDAMDRLTIEEDTAQLSDGDIEFGSVRLEVHRGESCLGVFSRSDIPGAPGDPVTTDQLRFKAAGCLGVFKSMFDSDLPILKTVMKIHEARQWLA